MAKKLKEDSNNLVVKEDNWIIQETYTEFTREQNQLIKFLIANCADYKNRELKDKVFSVGKVSLGTGKKKSGVSNKTIKKAVWQLFKSDAVAFKLYDPVKKTTVERYKHYFNKIDWIDEKELHFKVVWDSDIKQYFSGNASRFTQFKLEEYLKLNSPRSQNLYELLKSYQNYEDRYGAQPSFDVSYLRWKLRMENVYPTYDDFRRELKKLIKEINTKTDITVAMKKDKESGPVEACVFHIEQKNPPVMYLNCWFENERQRDEIIYDYKSKDKIEKLGEIKKVEPDKYEKLRSGGKSDYDIIMTWVNNERIIEEAKKSGNVIDYDAETDEKAKLREHIEKEELPGWYGITEGTAPEPELLVKALELQKKGS